MDNIIPDSQILHDIPCQDGMKRCSKCGKCLPETPEHFSRDKKGQNGLHYWCLDCTRSVAREYKAKNKVRVASYQQEYMSGRKEWLRDYKQRYRQENKEEIAKYRQEYNQEHPEKKIAADHRRRARILGVGGQFSDSYLQTLYELQKGRCCWCGSAIVNRLVVRRAPRNEIFTVDHIIPIARGGTNWAWNTVLACFSCNISHNSKLIFLEWQPSAILVGMEIYILRAYLLHFVFSLMLWRLKINQ